MSSMASLLGSKQNVGTFSSAGGLSWTTDRVEIGNVAPDSSVWLNLSGNLASGAGTQQFAVAAVNTVQSSLTTSAYGWYGGLNTAAAAFTLTNLRNFAAFAGSKGAGSTITNWIGYYANNSAMGTNNWAFQSAMDAAANARGFYASGTALNEFAGAILLTPQALSGAGAINTTAGSTFYTSTGAAQALTLANGTAGQIKTIIHVVDGGSGVLTPTTALGYATITFTNAGESAVLQYTAAGWAILSLRGAVAA